MTRPTGDVGLPVPELRIDVAHHLEHHASLQLFGLGIERQVVHVVAVYAAESERESNVLHRDFDVLRREHFEIGGTNDCSPSRREWRHPAAAAPATASPTPTASRHRESVGSPGQILDDDRNLLVGQTGTLLLHASDCGGPRVFVRHLVPDAIEVVARGAGSGHQVGRYSIGTGGGSLSCAGGTLSWATGCLGENHGCNEQEGCGHIQEELL